MPAATIASPGPSPFSAAGVHTVDTTVNPPTLTPPGGVPVIAGVLTSTTIPVAVFVFDSVTIPVGVTVRAVGTRPFALLSRGAVTVNGTIDVSSGSSTGAGGRGALSIGSGASAANAGEELAGAGGAGRIVILTQLGVLDASASALVSLNGGNGGAPGPIRPPPSSAKIAWRRLHRVWCTSPRASAAS